MKGAIADEECFANEGFRCAKNEGSRFAGNGGKFDMKKEDDPLKGKSMAFAVRAVKLAKWLREEKKEFSLADQILRSGTSIGANLSESRYAASRKDFLAKCKISLKECSETLFWIELLEHSGLIASAQAKSLSADCNDIRRILAASCKTLEQNLQS
jgi:four helix bundle protein